MCACKFRICAWLQTDPSVLFFDCDMVLWPWLSVICCDVPGWDAEPGGQFLDGVFPGVNVCCLRRKVRLVPYRHAMGKRRTICFVPTMYMFAGFVPVRYFLTISALLIVCPRLQHCPLPLAETVAAAAQT